VPTTLLHEILGSLGGALGVAKSVGGATGALLAHAARAAFISGMNVSLLVGAIVGFGGVVLVLVLMPSRPLPPWTVLDTTPIGNEDQPGLVLDGDSQDQGPVVSVGRKADR
jgi:hypothetical protein